MSFRNHSKISYRPRAISTFCVFTAKTCDVENNEREIVQTASSVLYSLANVN